MKLEQSFTVHAPVPRSGTALIDVERVAPCLPGAEITGSDDDGTYQGVHDQARPDDRGLPRDAADGGGRRGGAHRDDERARDRQARPGRRDGDDRLDDAREGRETRVDVVTDFTSPGGWPGSAAAA